MNKHFFQIESDDVTAEIMAVDMAVFGHQVSIHKTFFFVADGEAK